MTKPYEFPVNAMLPHSPENGAKVLAEFPNWPLTEAQKAERNRRDSLELVDENATPDIEAQERRYGG